MTKLIIAVLVVWCLWLTGIAQAFMLITAGFLTLAAGI